MRSLVTVGLLLAASASLLGQAPPSETSLRWIELPSPQLEVNGLPWYGENGGKLFRLPERLKDTYRKPVWEFAQSPSGGRIRFRTDSSALATGQVTRIAAALTGADPAPAR